jgi:DNA polymerase theta
MEEREIDRVCSSLGIPPTIIEAYSKLGITHLYQWQIDCLRDTNVLKGNNLVYCAPTSGGKTMVAELVLLKTSIVTRKKSIFVLPFISLIKQKERDIKRLLANYNKLAGIEDRIKVKGYYGDISSRKIQENIILCTIEKANGILNRILAQDSMHNQKYLRDGTSIGCVVIDEMHIMGDPFRGYLLEMLIRYRQRTFYYSLSVR